MASRGEHRRPAAPGPRRGTLTADAFERAAWWTRYFCAAADITQGAGFLLGAPVNSATFRAMEFLAPLWLWGVVLVAVGVCIPFGRIQVPAFAGMIVWALFLVFNTLSLLPNGAWAMGVFLLPVGLHLGMFWYITRSSLPGARRPGR